MTATPALTSAAGTRSEFGAFASKSPRDQRSWSRKVAVDIVAAVDGLAVISGAFLPVIIYDKFGGLEANWILTLQSSVACAAITFVLWRKWGLYDEKRLNDFPDYPGRLLTGLIIALFAVIGLGLPLAITKWHLWIWYAAWASASYTMLLANHGISNMILAKLTSAGRFDQRVAVYGAGQIARRVRDHLTASQLGIHFSGVYDDRIDGDRVTPEGLTVSGRLDDLITAAYDGCIDQIIIALPQVAEDRMSQVAKRFEHLPVSVHIVTHIASDLVGNQIAANKVSALGAVGMLDVKENALSDWAPIFKRAEDLILGTFFLLFSAPFFMLIALAIKAQKNGPVIDRQKLRGRDGEVFDAYLFHTTSGDEIAGDAGDGAEAPSRTANVGTFLRRFSLEKLPQLINVLKGEMSLVGPRAQPFNDNESGADRGDFKETMQAKPGLTGLAQVRGLHNQPVTNNKLKERFACDMEYINGWSLALDLSILAQSFWVILAGRKTR